MDLARIAFQLLNIVHVIAYYIVLHPIERGGNGEHRFRIMSFSKPGWP